MPMVRLRDALLIAILVVHLTLVVDAKRHHASVASIVRSSQQVAKVKRESGTDDQYVADATVVDDDGKRDSAEVIYDQRQVNGETNIRLSIKNVQIQLPESQLEHFQKSSMAKLIQNSVLRLLGIDLTSESASEATSSRPPLEQPSSTEKQQTENLSLTLPDISASMLQTLTALTAGGSSEAEMATPTSDPMFSPKMAIATAAPDGSAIAIPTSSECVSQRANISCVIPSPTL
uniref:Uncharacterized protein n=1 Tax=Anopheles farauti TaxID=69004 RepID=A0A182Q761_9DIPT